MSDDQLGARLEQIFADVLADDVSPRLVTKLNSPGWDSFAQLALVTAIEQEFSIALDDDEAIELNSFDSALEIVREHVS